MQMHHNDAPIGPLDHRITAVKRAKDLAVASGRPAFVYHRALDAAWFVLTLHSTADEGQTLHMVVHPRIMAIRKAG